MKQVASICRNCIAYCPITVSVENGRAVAVSGDREAPLQAFGQTRTHRSLWLSTTTHLHEHLGQLIAYARSNKVTPPWSK